jgi:hypothetical protein
MRLFILIAGVALFLGSCTTNYEVKDLHGKWMGESMGFTFNEDNSCEIFMSGAKDPRKVEWRDAMGNTLEFTSNGKVILSNVTVKSLKDDVLTIEMRPLLTTRHDISTVIHVMKRVE